MLKEELDNSVVEVSSEVQAKVAIKRDFCPHRRVSHRICKECGKMYQLTDNDAVYFITKFGSLPLRCESCRTKNKPIVIPKVEG